MKRFLILGLKIIGSIVAVVVVLLLGAAIIFNTSSFQNKMMAYSADMLAERLQTKVKIDSVSINFLTFDVNLLGVEIEDREQRKMFDLSMVQIFRSSSAKDWGCMDVVNALTTTIRLAVGLI